MMKKMLKKLRDTLNTPKRVFLFLALAPLVISVAVALCFTVLMVLRRELSSGMPYLPQMFGSLLSGTVVFCCILYPLELALVNLVALIRVFLHPEKQVPGTGENRLWSVIDFITILIGLLLSTFYAALSNIRFDAQWDTQLINAEVHQPVWSGGWLHIGVLLLLAAASYFFLNLKKSDDTPPLVTVLCISALYPGAGVLLLLIVQMMNGGETLPLLLLPACCLSIMLRVIVCKISEWNLQEEHDERFFMGNSFLTRCNRLLRKSACWPLAALLLTVPLLGIILGLLTLFGQTPDKLVRAFTETADWTLSKQTAPPNVMVDEHYLCTVAAGGHEKIVKPLRMGVRHNHRIVVNRQLLIANAFEQILESAPRACTAPSAISTTPAASPSPA